MANIFCLSKGLMEEDRFTASLNYVVDCYPSVGQAIADYLLQSAGKPSSKFIRSDDHPVGTAENRPDFLLECEAIDIICEHKIDSPLGKKQLERYLQLHRSKPFYLALISNGLCKVPEAAIRAEGYISPNNSDVPHFLWQSIYPLIDGTEHRLVSDFKEYMRTLSMKPIASGSWSDLFNHQSTAEAFGHQWTQTKAYFKQLGARCVVAPGNLGMEIGYPNDWMHLLYVFVSPNADLRHQQVEGPYLGAKLFIDSKAHPALTIGNLDEPIDFECGTIFPRARSKHAKWNKHLNLVCDYYTSLDSILTSDSKALQVRLLRFTQAVFHHATANKASE